MERFRLRMSGIDGLAILSFAALSAALWRVRVMAPVTVDYNYFGNSDQFDYFYPLYRLAAQRLAAGELPLWNPAQLAGTPLLATPQIGAFYPPNLVHLLLPTERAFELLAFVHLVLAGCWVYAFTRTLGAKPAAALIGASVYAWSSFVVGTHLWAPMVAVLSWFALPLVGVAKIHRGDRLLGCAALGVGLAMLLLAGYLPHAVFGVQVAVAYAVWNAARTLAARDARGASRELRWLALGGALGALLAAPQWVPTLELVQMATRDTGGLTPEQLEPFGKSTLATWTKLFVPSERGTGNVAVIALLLVPAALIARRHRAEAGFFVAVAVVAGLIALGSATPLFELYLSLPGTKMFRGPSRILCLFVFGVATLAALGADNLLHRELGAEPQRSTALVASLLLGSVLIACGLWSPAWGVVGASAVMAACLLIPPSLAGYAVVALGLLTALNLASMPANSEAQIWRANGLSRYDVLRTEYRQLASQLQLGRVLVERSPAYPLATAPRVLAALHGLNVFEDYEPLSMRRYADYAAFLQHGRLYEGDRERRHYAGSLAAGPIVYPRLLAAAGVQVIARITAPLGTPLLEIERVQRALPRAYIVHGIRASSGASSTLREIAEGRVHLRSEVVLESPPASALAPPAGPEPTEWVRIARYAPESVKLDVRMQRSGALVLLDVDYPGWRAKVNGKHARIYNANHLFRAILLPAGRHKVSFRYQPASVRAGSALGLIGILVLAGLGATAAYLRRATRRALSPHATF